ncbi:MAG: tRNA uridine-5-carboxymethylaminomethyl(34) synthesis enzyme MnmG [Deltaproteobacteria bacterium CG11_big_fil_rev_8_21_14_0_20_45_16]|nr:MAG: tRNA uridine-5-carboxymethylaminomethyl(34) synthesis enzyme MnmG [Deltaproteobacteria bacterium CG11_big_fil_rev_8_21_14_0_20_45_16]
MNFDVIVVGAGHAGVEAARAASQMGCQVLLLTMNADQIAAMSCNPAIGGLSKSQIAKEIDILGGWMARVADESAYQYRVLNERKGPAVQATRVQVDRHEYRQIMKFRVENQSGLLLKQAQVARLLFEGSKIKGIETSIGQKFFARQIIITTGTFMNGKAHIGRQSFASGRAGEPPSLGLSDFLKTLGIKISRFKTGTVPRVDARSVDFSRMERQESQTSCAPLSIFSEKLRPDLRAAYLAYTNPKTHETIRASLDQSPLYSGIIESRGPRYCPSVEDKIVRFADKDRHQLFLEREGRWTNEVYVGGVSTSLPYDCQLEFLRTIEGLESVEIIRPGYAIEYDYIDATQLLPSLEMKEVPGLYFAGQVNGTSGYEEAGAQGLMAGINSGLKNFEKEPLILKRSEAYIGVLIDDLVSKTTNEPYRMLSSRAEWRLLLREDNAEQRLYSYAKRNKLLSLSDEQKIEAVLDEREKLHSKIKLTRVLPSQVINSRLAAVGQNELKSGISVHELLKRPGFELPEIEMLVPLLFAEHAQQDWKRVMSDVKYEGYIRQCESQLKQMERLERLKIPLGFNFSALKALPIEAREKLTQIRPATLGQAGRISGITPASISVLAIHLSKASDKGACVNE